MAKPPQPGYIYMDSAIIGQRIAFHKSSGWVFCQDTYPDGKLVSYSPAEIEILKKAGNVDLMTHLVKKIFSGEVVGFDGRQEPDN
jgi:hypothetical protein